MNAQLNTGSCHCGAVRFEARTALTPATRCNCSLCRRKGALMSPTFSVDDLQIIDGTDALALYQFNTRAARHFFCKVCGIYPFHQARKDPQAWRVNIGCLDGVDSYALKSNVVDGASLSVVEEA
jgi:hypothetical protein